MGGRGRAGPPGQVRARRREPAAGRGRGEFRSPPLRPPLSPAAPPRFAMVERGDAAPLLRWAEGPAVSPPQAPELQAGGRGWGAGGRGAAEPPRRREPEELGASEVLLQPGRLELGDVEEDQVVAVFVVTFDPRSGESLSQTRGGRGSPPTGAGGGGGGARCARTRIYTPAPPPRRGAPAEGAGRPRQDVPRSLGAGRGALFLAPSDPLSLPSGCFSAVRSPRAHPHCGVRAAPIEGLVCGFCFLFLLGYKGFFSPF